MSGPKKYAVPVPDSAKPGHTPIYRANLPFGPEVSSEAAFTLHENFLHGVSVNPNGPCVGWRPIDAKGKAGDFLWLTYLETFQRIQHFAAGLEKLKACPVNEDPEAKGMRMMGFYAKNRLEWVVGEQACHRQSIVPVPLYDTLGPTAVEYVVKQTLLAAMCCTTTELPNVITVAKACPTLKSIFIMDSDKVTEAVKSKAKDDGLNVYSFKEVEALGAKNPCEPNAPANHDVAFFCYTSGTTGDPKGALITHAGLLSCTAAVRRVCPELDLGPGDVHLSYLPLPHVFERTIQARCYFGGAAVGFYQGDTLKILEDLNALRPTIFPSVPRLLNRVYDKILAGVNEAGGVKQIMFEKALAAKTEGLKKGKITHPIWDTLVFGPLRKKLGMDRLKVIITGSAPISGQVMSFLRAALGPVMEGYGQTESSCVITFTDSLDYTVGHVGAPVPCNEVRLEDVPDMGYLNTDRIHGKDEKAGVAGIPCMGRGEICFRGPNVFQRYYKMPDKTAEAVDKEGWCHTGDIGLFTPDGKIKIIDRKKNIFKLAQGEYVAAEKIENVLQGCSLIAQAFVYGDSLKSYLVAVLVPDQEAVVAHAAKNNLGKGLSFKQLCVSPDIKAAILKQMKKATTDAKLQKYEVPQNVAIHHEPFSVDNGLLTPTFKLKRKEAEVAFKTVVDALYAEPEGGPKVPSKL
eukprot:g1616.t1